MDNRVLRGGAVANKSEHGRSNLVGRKRVRRHRRRGPGIGRCRQHVGRREGGHTGPADGRVSIHYEERNGVAVWQGDIDLRMVEQDEGGQGGFRTQSFAMGNRAAMAQAGSLWLNNVVPYRFDPSISNARRTTIEQAIQHYNARTPLKFSFDSTNSAADYLLFTDDDTGCHAGLGRSPGANRVFVDDKGCGFAPIGTRSAMPSAFTTR